MVWGRICYKVDISKKLFAIQYLFEFLEHFQAYLELELGQQIWQWWTQARLTSSKWALRAHLELAVGWTQAWRTRSKCALRAHLELVVEWKQASLINFTQKCNFSKFLKMFPKFALKFCFLEIRKWSNGFTNGTFSRIKSFRSFSYFGKLSKKRLFLEIVSSSSKVTKNLALTPLMIGFNASFKIEFLKISKYNIFYAFSFSQNSNFCQQFIQIKVLINYFW